MKKVLILFLAAALLLPLAACGGTGDKQDITGPTATDDPTTDTQTPTNDLEDTMRTLIVKNEKIASVTVQTGENAAEKYAGRALAKYLAKLGLPSGDGLTIDVRIDPELPEEGYEICPENGKITIRGGGDRGVIYGVYGFLTHYAGTRFFMPGLEKLGAGDIVVNESYSMTPVFEHRMLDWACTRNDSDWCVKNGVNAPAWAPIPENMGGIFDYLPGMSVHTLSKMTGTDQRTEQPCLSDPEVLKTVIAYVRDVLAQNPDASIISVSQNDNNNYCKCPKCTAVDEEEGSHAGTLLRFVNAVAADIADDYPNVVIDTLAYLHTTKPPQITKPLPNVCIRLCTFDCCFSHPISDPTCHQNSVFAGYLRAWNEICDRIYIWDYVVDFRHYIPPYPNLLLLRENMRYFAEHGVRGMYPEGNYTSENYGEFGELRCWLLAQLMMNPYMSEDEYSDQMNEFLEAYYGAGWQNIRKFIDWTSTAAADNHVIGCYKAPFVIISEAKYLSMEKTIDGWWDEAQELAGDRAEYVRRSRTQWEYIKLMLHPDAEKAEQLRRYLEKENIAWSEGNYDLSKLYEDLEAPAPVSYAYAFRTHENAPTPEGDNSVVRLLGEDRIVAYLPFDGDTEPGAGIVTAKESGKLPYEEGYFGQAARFDDGYVTLDGWKPGKKSFSVALWMKTDGAVYDPCLLSNKDWMGGNNPGFVFALRESDVIFNAGNGTDRKDTQYPLPADYAGGWVYLVLVVDREAGEIRFSYDFEALRSAEIPASLKDVSFDTNYKLNIGQDGTGHINLSLTATLDEYLIVDGVLTDADVAALKAHYVQ